jgi:hypothetical protein
VSSLDAQLALLFDAELSADCKQTSNPRLVQLLVSLMGRRTCTRCASPASSPVAATSLSDIVRSLKAIALPYATTSDPASSEFLRDLKTHPKLLALNDRKPQSP